MNGAGISVRVVGRLFVLPSLPFRIMPGMGPLLPALPTALRISLAGGRPTMVPLGAREG